ncbi:MAG: multicopper oxidase family protein [Hyphomicrobiaceae bacterium]
MHRRDLLKAGLAGVASATVLSALRIPSAVGQSFAGPAQASLSAARELRIISRTLDVNKRAAKVFGLVDAEGRPGLAYSEGDTFRVSLVNGLSEPTLIHWHGLRPPYDQDGVPGMPLAELKPGERRAYEFPVGAAGTHWMHAHTLQEQNLLAAPLVVREREMAGRDEQEIIVLLHDFSFTPAEELLSRLKRSTGGHGMHGMAAMGRNDINYDAYLANDRTLDDPEVVRVESGGRVRLRIINGAAATVFTIDTGEIEAELIAVDGKDVSPLRGRRFPMAMGQRIDLRLQLPKDAKAYPVLALRERALERTGLVLAPPAARIAKLAATGSAKPAAMGFDLEARLRAKSPLAARAADRTLPIMLTGGMGGYQWGIFDAAPLSVRKGERVHIVMQNHSMTAHPMHLHGHHFQVIGINGRELPGALRDTLHVPPMTSVTIAFDADHPGKWAFHCHHLYHMASGMMAMLRYEGLA